MVGIGLDFGTTNSTLAVFDGKNMSYVEIDRLAANPYVMPTALYLDRNFMPTIGTEAIIQYLRENEGRQIRLSKEELGEVEISYGELGMHQVAIHANVDRDMPGMLFHGLKRWLGDNKLEYIKVLEKDYKTIALITPILEHIKLAAEKKMGKSLDSVHIGRPIHFEGESGDANAIALQRLTEASRNAGLSGSCFYPEPLGASLSYLQNYGSKSEDIVLTFDFGGGTLDLSLICKEAEGFEILATHGVPIGGVKIDQEIFDPIIFPKLGKGSMVRSDILSSSKELTFGFYKFIADLLNWKNTHRLNTIENIKLIERGIANSDRNAARRLRRLKTLIQTNSSYYVHKAIEDAKIRLSDKESTLIDIEDIALSVMLTRDVFEDIIKEIMLELGKCVDVLLEKAGINAGDVDIVIRTGGSSLIPLVKKDLESRFPGKVVEYDVFKSIAAGLAIANFYGYEYSPD